MHLFLIDLFISIDVLAPIINIIDKKKVIICNINPIQDHSKNKLISFFVKKKIKYFNFLPLDEKKLLSFFFIKLFKLLPCNLQTRLRFFVKKIYLQENLSSKDKIKNFLVKNKVRSITYEESAPSNYISQIYEVANNLKIKVIKIPSGLGVGIGRSIVDKNKLGFCDKLILPNKVLKVEKKFERNVKILGSLRYTFSWFMILDKIFGKKAKYQKNITLGFFKKYQSKEANLINEIITKLENSKKYSITTREKPRDIFSTNCNIFENDTLTSSQLINNSDIIISSRPSSILLEALLKKKKIILILYANPELKKTPFYLSKIFIKVRSFSRLNIELNKKNIKNYKKYRKNFLTKTLVNWENEKKIRLNFKSFYNSL